MTTSAGGAAPHRRQPVDELHDAPEDLELPGRFGEYLRYARETLTKAFVAADAAAIRYQGRHRWTTGIAAILGTITLLASTAHVVTTRPPLWAVKIELGGAVLSVFAVLIGISAAWHEKWLVARYQAEQFRLLKFDFLSQEHLWKQPAGTWQRELEHRMQQIGVINRSRLEDQADEDHVVPLISPELTASIPANERRAISSYYLRRRLEVQISYFSRMASKKSWWPLENRRLAPIVFFGSLALLTYHLTHELETHRPESIAATRNAQAPVASPAGAGASSQEAGASKASDTEPADRPVPGFLLASLALPALWAGVRTFRSANEFGRNRARSAAKRSALTEVAERMERDPPPIQSLLQNVALAESVLAGDQGEWLRLMLEAEWYA